MTFMWTVCTWSPAHLLPLSMELKLSDFGISELTGFVPPSPPLRCLPSAFSTWEALAGDLSTVLKERTIRDKVRALPAVEWSETTLRSEAEWWRAYVVLTFISQAYLWAEGEAGLPHTLPEQLARPWCTVADHLGVPPVITYSAGVLNNWGLRDPSGPIDSDNLYALTTFTGSVDESWFFTTHILVELAAVPGLRVLPEAFAAIERGENACLVGHLHAVQSSLQNMQRAAKRMYDHCDQKSYFLKVRHFMTGSKGVPLLPNGLVYEGVDPSPRQYCGASAAQSSSVQAFDVFLSVSGSHSGSEAEFLQEMRTYMPRKHGEFLKVLGKLPSVREYVRLSGDAELIQSYNSAVQALADFRSEHIILATRYIIMQKGHATDSSLNETGTGGTNFVQFLKRARDDTLSMKIELLL